MANSPGHSLQSASHDPERFTFRRPWCCHFPPFSGLVTCGCEQNLHNQDTAALKSREPLPRNHPSRFFCQNKFSLEYAVDFREAGVCSHMRPAIPKTGKNPKNMYKSTGKNISTQLPYHLAVLPHFSCLCISLSCLRHALCYFNLLWFIPLPHVTPL